MERNFMSAAAPYDYDKRRLVPSLRKADATDYYLYNNVGPLFPPILTDLELQRRSAINNSKFYNRYTILPPRVIDPISQNLDFVKYDGSSPVRASNINPNSQFGNDQSVRKYGLRQRERKYIDTINNGRNEQENMYFRSVTLYNPNLSGSLASRAPILGSVRY